LSKHVSLFQQSASDAASIDDRTLYLLAEFFALAMNLNIRT
jgi:hypothetical protein